MFALTENKYGKEISTETADRTSRHASIGPRSRSRSQRQLVAIHVRWVDAVGRRCVARGEHHGCWRLHRDVDLKTAIATTVPRLIGSGAFEIDELSRSRSTVAAPVVVVVVVVVLVVVVVVVLVVVVVDVVSAAGMTTTVCQ